MNSVLPLSPQIASILQPGADAIGSLAELFADIRKNGSSKTLVVFDQFEQILSRVDQRQSNQRERDEVIRALRQADGQHLQVILVVRDEFWSAVSQLMRSLDAPLRDGRNAMALERFTSRHAAKVLRFWGRSIGIDVDESFVRQALELVSDGDRVIPVRLALLATVLDEDWSESSIDRIRSQGSLSGYYLESVLGELAPSARQKLKEPALEVLRAVTPATGRIRGAAIHLRNLKLACRAAGYDLAAPDFADLIDLLDRQLHLM